MAGSARCRYRARLDGSGRLAQRDRTHPEARRTRGGSGIAVSRIFIDPAERYFEDFCQGDVVITRGRTVEAADFAAFAGLVGNYYPLHIDHEYGRKTRLGSRVAHGSFTLSLAIGLVGMTGYLG